MRMNIKAAIGVIERLKDALHTEFFKCPVNFRESQVKADKERTFDAVNIKCYKTIAR